jgi:hypothetical protein
MEGGEGDRKLCGESWLSQWLSWSLLFGGSNLIFLFMLVLCGVYANIHMNSL